MKTRKEIYDIYLNDFAVSHRMEKFKNSNFVPTNDFIEDSLAGTLSRFKKDLGNALILNEEEKDSVIKKIKSIYAVFQEEGDVILGDYNHDYDWYKNRQNSKDYKTYFRDRYKQYLLSMKNFSTSVVEVLENDTLQKLMSYLGNPIAEEGFSCRGLVVGDVQSGKTSNYLGLITKASDAGYRVIFVLTGMIESLRRQTQQRIEEGFIGYDSINGHDVGVGRGDPMPMAFTSREKDFVNKDDQNTTYKLSNYSTIPFIFVLKKNVSVLKRVYSSLKNINIKPPKTKIDYPALIIDDEADNASINTNDKEHDPTKINSLIRRLLSLFTKNSYVGFTATPFANVFINYSDEDEMLKDDLFPRDFIYALKAPSNYLGPEKYFKDKNINVQCINLTETEKTSFPLNHKKNRFGKTLFDSCYESIRTFLIANVIRDIRDVDIDTHRSMLINMSKFKDVQFTIKEIVEEYVSSIKRAIKQTHKLELTTAMRNPFVKSLKETFDVQFFDLQQENNQITRENVFKKIYKSISKIKIIVVNSSKNSSKLNYEDTKEGLRVIAVGGLALSRGLTLEGLMTSYFYRNTSTFDVLLQMGRWFGYRHGYDDLCRIWVTEAAEQNYRYIYESIKLLRQDIKTMGEEKRKPVDFGIRVRNDSIELGITAPNKMRNTESIRIIKTFYGGIFETPYILKDLDLNEQNIVNALSFLNEIDSSNRDHLITQHPYFRDISFSNVIKLLKSLHISERGQTYFDKKRILDFMEQNENDLKLFDVLIIGGKQKINGEKNPNRFIFPKHNIDIPLVGRKFDIRDDDVRMSRGRLRLGGRTDTQYGLNEEEMPITNTKAQDFLIEGRNPLLIIYFIRPSLPKDLDEEDFVSDKDTKEDFVDMFKFHRELSKRKFKYLVGFSIGFPRKKGVSFESNRFTVNKSVNYYEKDHYETNESEEE